MRVFARDRAEGTTEGSLEIVRWEQFEGVSALPFGVMWYTVAPGSASPLDDHPDVELSIVQRGQAEVEAGGAFTVVPQGSAFLLDGGEPHVIHNRSAETPLDILSIYWLAEDAEDAPAIATASRP